MPTDRKLASIDLDQLAREAREAGESSALARRAVHHGALVAAASVAPPGIEVPTVVTCRRRPGRKSCRASILARRQQVPAVVRWRCPACSDAGQIMAWERTPWNLGPHLPPAEEGERQVVVPLEAEALEILMVELREHHPSMAVLHMARAVDAEHYQLAAAPSQLAVLVRAAAEAGEAGNLLPTRDFELYMAVQEIVEALERDEDLDEDDEASIDGEELEDLLLFPPRSDGAWSSTSPRLYRLHVQLRDVQPSIWRRIEVQSDITLADLHEILQEVMGWKRAHLYLFRTSEGLTVADPRYEGSAEAQLRAPDVRFHEIAPQPGGVLSYHYDFGDGWEHDVRVESSRPGRLEFPRIHGGRRACPPEDCGGPPGYSAALKLLSAPQPEDLAEVALLLEHGFDAFEPEAFDLRAAQRRLELLASARS